MSVEIDHEFTPFIVCPYCGSQHTELCEYSEDEDDMLCEECNKEFHYERIETVEFITSKKGAQ